MSIQKVAVLGAGVMGQGIAAHLANAGIPSVLFDIVPKEGDRNALAAGGLTTALEAKPANFYHRDFVNLVTPANYEDHGALLGDCDLIIEVVVEYLPIKQKVYEWVAANRKPGSIVASNTSGIKLADMAASMPEEMRQHFVVMHFFNPVRYMRLLEIVAGDDTLPAVVEQTAAFGERVLGKGIVYAKDTANFVANRIGCYGMVSVFDHMVKQGLNVEEVDVVAGPPMGRPKSAVFRTADLVGLDTLDHVLGNVRENAADVDPLAQQFESPAWLKRMVDEGALGKKSGGGFYKSDKSSGKRVITVRDLETGAYAPISKPRFASVKAAKKGGVKALIAGDDKAAAFAWAVTADVLIYSAHRIPEIADDIVNIDRGMRWGFGWDQGPFETWDLIGVAESVARMEAEGREVPANVKRMLAAGRESFYGRNAEGLETYWDLAADREVVVPKSEGWLILSDVKARTEVVNKNGSASLLDLGDGIAGLQFHSKMNSLDADIGKMYIDALDRLDAGEFDGLVVGNQGPGPAFCAGANVFVVLMMSMQKQWDQLDAMLVGLQSTLMRAKYNKKPVVTAPWGLTLGGGAEVAMHSSATVAGGELYMGLVEVGVGLIPGAGGCKEMLVRYLGDIPEGTEYDPNPFVQQAFKNIGLASVATSCEEARGMRYLRPQDKVTIDPDALIADAKKMARGLADAAFVPPHQRKVKLPGASGRSTIELFLYSMAEGGYATPHDVTVGKKLAWVMTGGDAPGGTWHTEDDLLALEREAFLSLCGDPKTQARIQHFLKTNKPLRN